MATALAGGGVDLSRPVEIADRLWWVGSWLEGDDFQCHTYLLEHGDQSVLFDPGSLPVWPQVRRKIEQVVDWSRIGWIVCHHQDPDITAALPAVAELVAPDTPLVMHRRTAALVKHLGLSLPVWHVDEHDWRLDLGGRELEFLFTPYLHFAGAFCSFDRRTGTLISSDLFGGTFAEPGLMLGPDESLDGIEAFHSIYMPSRENLLPVLFMLQDLPLRLIAPQHGRIIPAGRIPEVIGLLEQIECGLLSLEPQIDAALRLQVYNRILRSMLQALTTERDFSALARILVHNVRQILPVEEIDYVFRDGEPEAPVYVALAERNLYHGEPADELLYSRLIGMSRQQWQELVGRQANAVTCRELGRLFDHDGDCRLIVLPLFDHAGDRIDKVAVFHLRRQTAVGPELDDILGRLAEPLGVAVERELIRRSLKRERDRVYAESIRDPLTGLFTRRYMDDVAARMIQVHDRGQGTGFAVLMMDIDWFKRVNDTYGHQVGDVVLREVAAIMLETCRKSDVPVRYGGEEFALFVPVADREQALALAERIRGQVAALEFPAAGQTFRVTISIGVALHETGEPLQAVLARADRALYAAKQNGRDRVVLDPDPA